jgi:hypothetical protein
MSIKKSCYFVYYGILAKKAVLKIGNITDNRWEKADFIDDLVYVIFDGINQ